ncbi:MAG: ribonuclease H-like domain-containing protein [Desulfomonilia bacterium]|nr:ribonuclease H-like domain-containing protein [Desulfomonilia bacterium]
MNVKDRLRRLTGERIETHGSPPDKEVITDLRKKIHAILERSPARSTPKDARYTDGSVRLEQVITGEEVRTPQGMLFFSRTVFMDTTYHGIMRIGDFPRISMDSLGILAKNPVIALHEPCHALFLDTETTGLSGGTGTFPFLIGLGWFEGDHFITCQLFARDFSEEKALLSFLQELSSDKKFLVTFNGKAYDLPLLASRYILNRLEDPFLGKEHLDLLHPCRRLLGHRLENTRLATLESSILGLNRRGDIPGFEIPQRYFDWLRRRDGRLMEDVFEHNRIDVISMAAITKHLSDLLDGSLATQSVPGADLFCVARLHLERGNTDASRSLLEGLLCSPDTGVAKQAREILSLLHKRAGNWDEAVVIWEKMLEDDVLDIFASVELAKWCEHKSSAFERARELVWNVLEQHPSLDEEQRLSLEYRLRRLIRKIHRDPPAE